MALVLELLQVLGASAVAGTVNAARAKWQWHPQTRNIVVTRESAAVINAVALRLLLDAGLNRNTERVSLEAQTQ